MNYNKVKQFKLKKQQSNKYLGIVKYKNELIWHPYWGINVDSTRKVDIIMYGIFDRINTWEAHRLKIYI